MAKPKKWAFRFWMLWLGAFVVMEGLALLDDESGDTLSESIWSLQHRFPTLTVGLAFLLGWLFWHFVVDKRSRKK